MVAEQQNLVSKLWNCKCHKAESQNGRFCTFIPWLYLFYIFIFIFFTCGSGTKDSQTVQLVRDTQRVKLSHMTLPGFTCTSLGSWISSATFLLQEQQTAKIAEPPGTRKALVKCEFSNDLIFYMRREMSPEYCVAIPWDTRYDLIISQLHFSTSSSSHAHSERTLECAGLGHGLASAWSEVGDKTSWTWNNWEELPWGYCTLQTRDVGSLASKCQTSHVESSCWCPFSDGKARSCLEDSKKALQLLHWHWCVSISYLLV